MLKVMDMSADELKLLADHMGHSVAMHTEIYRLQTSVLERTKVARALVALENGSLGDFRGRSLSSISLEGELKNTYFPMHVIYDQCESLYFWCKPRI